MNFLNPFALIGLAAATIPVILHLLNLRKLKQIEFSSLKFLKELQKNKIRRLKIRQIILLILRTLLIIFAVLSFSRPAVKSSLPFMGTYTKTSAVILVDNSFSMDVSDEGGNRFTQAKNCVKTILAGLRDGDDAAIIPLAGVPATEQLDLSRNIDYLRDYLSNMRVSNVSADLETAIRRANTLAQTSENLNKEIYIISDARRNVLLAERTDSAKVFSPDMAVFFVPVGATAKSETANIGIDSVSVKSRILQKDKPADVEFIVHNYSNRDFNGVSAGLFFNEIRVAQRLFDLKAGEEKSIEISAPPQASGAVSGRVELSADALEPDNRRFFGFVVPDKPKVLIAGNQSSTDYVSLILGRLQLRGESLAEVSTGSPSSLSSMNLAAYDAVIVCGGPFRQADYDRLEQFVRSGGSAIIFADPATDVSLQSQAMARFGFGGLSDMNYGSGSEAAFSQFDKSHPLFEGVFKTEGTAGERTESPGITRALAARGGLSIIDIPGGSFLAESSLGEGRAIYCAVPPSAEWSNMPFTGIFPTITHRSVAYLVSPRDFAINLLAGGSANITLPKKVSGSGSFTITDPDGTDNVRTAVVFPSGSAISLNNLDITGNYKVADMNGKTLAVFSVNCDKRESDLTAAEKAQIEQALAGLINQGVPLEIFPDAADIGKQMSRARTGTELWLPFLILAIMAALAEMVVARISKADAGE